MGASRPKKHTGRTTSGSTRDLKIQRIGRVTVYKRGTSYYLYYREGKKSVRRKVDGNLATARAAAAKVSASLEEGSPSPFGFARRSVDEVISGFLEYCEEVQGLALRLGGGERTHGELAGALEGVLGLAGA